MWRSKQQSGDECHPLSTGVVIEATRLAFALLIEGKLLVKK